MPPSPRWHAWKDPTLELALIIGAYFVYHFSRGLVFPDLDAKGLENAGRVVSLEKWLGLFREPGWQSWVLDNAEWLVVFFNWVYIITYWPIVLAFGLFLFATGRPRYYYYRMVVMATLAAALVMFMLFPVASPFQITAHFVNTIQEFGPSIYGSPEMAVYYNVNAAMPSLHFSWTIILGVAFVRTFKGWVKLLGVAYPGLTFLSITLTGNHFIVDAAAGGLLSGAAFAAIEVGTRRRVIRVTGSWPGLGWGRGRLAGDARQESGPREPPSTR